MAEYTHNSVSIVVLGHMNPAILNHDWLEKQQIIPKKFFAQPAQSDSPFIQFLSTPPMAQLVYGEIVFTVEMGKFILKSNQPSVKADAFNVAKRYFEKLPHTPLAKVGFNVSGIIKFDSKQEEKSFDKKCVSCGDSLLTLINKRDIEIGFTLQYEEGKGCYRLDCTKERKARKAYLNCNWEFDVTAANRLIGILGEGDKYARKMDKLNRSIAEI